MSSSATTPLLKKPKAQELAAVVGELHGGDSNIVANNLAESAAATSTADSKNTYQPPSDSKKHNDGELAPLNADKLADVAAVLAQELPAVAGELHGGDSNIVAKNLADSAAAASTAYSKNPNQTPSNSKKQKDRELAPLNANTLADAAASLADDLRDTSLADIAKAFASKARKYAKAPHDKNAKAWLALAARTMADEAVGKPQAAAVSDLVRATHVVMYGGNQRHASSGDKKQMKDDDEPTVDELIAQARTFAESASASSMADEAATFSRAVEAYGAGKDKNKKVSETQLTKAGMALFAAADRSPPSEANLAALVKKMTGDSQIVQLSGSKPASLLTSPCFSWWRSSTPSCSNASQDVGRPSWLERLWAVISAREPTLPIHAERQEKIIEKRQVLYGVSLGGLAAFLTSAAGTHIFPADYGAWIGGISVAVWIAVSSGMVMNQYGQMPLELLAARHFSHLGMMGLALLFCFYAFWAFFPTCPAALWILVALAIIFFGVPWATSCIRGDDDSSRRTE